MSEKRRCNNCGAYLEPNETVCYLCGEAQMPDVVSAPQRNGESRGSSMSFEKDEDFVLPSSSKSHNPNVSFGDKYDYADEEIAVPYYKNDEKRNNAVKKRNRKTAIIIVACILAAGIICGVCFCLINGVFGSKKVIDNKFTIYFDKPNSDIEFTKSDGTVYKWTDDVEVSYKVDNKIKTQKCAPCNDHDTLWRVKLPVKATSIYFFENGEKEVKTQILPGFDDDMVYYVSQDSFNLRNELILGQCERENFKGIGINYATTAPTTEPETTQPTETQAETQAETTEPEQKPTEEDDSRKTEDKGVYTVSLPKSWQSGVTAVEHGNCVTYYEDYNYGMYNMGKLASIYVFDAKDSEADNLTGVKDVRYNSDQTKKIVITTPTDIQFNEKDEEAQMKYLEKNKDLNSFLDSISVH